MSSALRRISSAGRGLSAVLIGKSLERRFLKDEVTPNRRKRTFLQLKFMREGILKFNGFYQNTPLKRIQTVREK